MNSRSQKLLEMAIEDLQKRIGIDREEIRIDTVEAVEWPDSSLGCPERGKAYLQVITPGFRILLNASEKRFEYHTDLRKVILCSEA